MKLLVCGPRTMTDRSRVWAWLNAINGYIEGLRTICCGDSRGVDRFAEEWAGYRHKTCEVFEADWETYGKAAGPIRNQQMLDEAQPDAVLAFQPIGKTTVGTQDMIRRARKAGKRIFLVEYPE